MNTVKADEPMGNETDIIQMTTDVVSAYVGGNPVPASDLPKLIAEVHGALTGLNGGTAAATAAKPEPAINPKRSVKQDHIVCLDCGQSFKSLKRHINSHHGLTPEEYIAKWNLPADYPMVAPEYAAARSRLAKAMGLGRKPGEKPTSKRK